MYNELYWRDLTVLKIEVHIAFRGESIRYTKHWLCIVTRVTPSQSYGEIPGFMAYLFRQLFLNRQNIFSWEDCLKENIFLFYVSRISMKWNIAKHKQMYRISAWTFIDYETHFRK